MRLDRAIFFFLLFSAACAAAQRPVWQSYTVEDGLTGNQVYDMQPDRNGYMWFAADQGLCRFNGYEFIRPVDTSAMLGTEAFVPAEDAQGRIWFARLDGSVWRVEKDTVRAWEHNSVAAPFLEKFKPIESLSVGKDGAVWLAIAGLGFLAVYPDGSHQVRPVPSKDGLLFAEVGGRLLFTSQFSSPQGPSKPKIQLSSCEGAALASISCTCQHYGERGIWRLRNGDLLFTCRGNFYLFSDGELRWSAQTGIIAEKAVEPPTGGLLLASHHTRGAGLHYYESIAQLRDGAGVNLLPGYFVTDVQFDREGGWWAATHHAGVLYCKNPEAAVFDQLAGLPTDEVSCLANDGLATIFAGLANGDIAAIDGRTATVSILPRPPLVSKEVEALYYDDNYQRLWCGQLLHYLEDDVWKIVSHRVAGKGVLAKKISPGADERTLWASASHGFFRIGAAGNTAVQLGKNEGQAFTERTFSVVSDRAGNIWVATPSGLKQWRDGAYELPPWNHPTLRFQARDLAVLPDGGMAVSLPGAGLLLKDAQGCFVQLTQREGLSSDFIAKLYLSPEGELFACSYSGLNRIRPSAGGGWEVASIDARKGLPSNHVKDVTVLNGVIWVATSRGLVRFRDLPAPLPMPPPVLERLLINNRTTDFSPGLQLPHTSNTLAIRFFALHYRSEGQISYRYRLGGSRAAFTQTSAREVQFANLSPGKYTFEVQAQNEVGQWSASTLWGFEIRPAWWQTGWFFAALFLAFAAALSLWFRSRLQEARHEAQVRSKIRELESAALRAQMNPHFIFNCLNSIQHFIAENDAAAATRYLARFARLVRLALHGSVDGQHSLREEIEMLESYLALEQLRFRGRFSYAIETSPDLDIDDLSLPPMLVQPFVENALLHGMKNKAEGGRITVAFTQQQNQLLVTIIDNGPGFDAGSGQTGPYKSVGMMLTQRRLEVLSGQGGGQAFSRENILGPEGAVCGTKVVLKM
jgi:ligand-binding sensor domain-containing protein